MNSINTHGNSQYTSQSDFDNGQSISCTPLSDSRDISYFTEADSVDVSHQEDLRSLLQTIASASVTQQYLDASLKMLRLRPNDAVIDVGCGPFPDLTSMMKLVSPSGRIVGVDKSTAMMKNLLSGLDSSLRKFSDISLEFYQQDAHSLGFADETFDAARAVRVLQHCIQPSIILQEMKRVVRPGGRVVVIDPDWATFSISGKDEEVTNYLINWVQDLIINPNMGARLSSLFSEIELTDITIEQFKRTLTTFSSADKFFCLTRGLKRLEEKGVISPAHVSQWLENAHVEEANNTFHCNLTIFVVGGSVAHD